MLKLPHKPNDALPIARAFNTLARTSEFKTIEKYLKEELSGIDKNLRSTEGSLLLRLQGAAQNLESLLKLFETTDQEVMKLQSSRK